MNLSKDAHALTQILQRYGAWDAEKDEKLNALEVLLTERHPDDKVVVFHTICRYRGVSDTKHSQNAG